jgi:hypothetical protein
VILEFDKVDEWEKLKELDVGFTRAGEEGFKSVLLALIDVLDATKEVTIGGPTVTIVVLELKMVVTVVLREVVLGKL